jgi:hypothetical protein
VTAAERAMDWARTDSALTGDNGTAHTEGWPRSVPDAPDPFQVELALAEVAAALDTGSAKKRAPLFGVDAAELLGADFPETQWQVTGLITRGGTAVIGGPPKAAKKTWLATEILIRPIYNQRLTNSAEHI